jgi:hypothetical protein
MEASASWVFFVALGELVVITKVVAVLTPCFHRYLAACVSKRWYVELLFRTAARKALLGAG